MCAWAKFPSRWIKGYEQGEKPSDDEIVGGLSELSWGKEKSAGVYALLVLVALSVLANEAQRAAARGNRRPPGVVTASYDAIASLTNISRSSIAKGLALLHEIGVIHVEKQGTSNVYELIGVDEDGGWCMLPETYLLSGRKHLKRLDFAQEQARKKAAMNAMKLYLLLLAFRDNSTGIANISYEKIQRYASIRKEEIRAAISLLLVNGLCVIVTSDEVPYEKEGQRHNRYRILGFKKGDDQLADRGLEQATAMAEADARNKAEEQDDEQDDFEE